MKLNYFRWLKLKFTATVIKIQTILVTGQKLKLKLVNFSQQDETITKIKIPTKKHWGGYHRLYFLGKRLVIAGTRVLIKPRCIMHLTQGSANFLGSRAGWAPNELAAGRTGKFYVKNLITVDYSTPLIMMSCHICKSTERQRGAFWYFLQDCFKINSNSLPLYTIFSNFTKNVPIY